MGNKLNSFEEQIREAANRYSEPYDASMWDKVEQGLDKGAVGSSSVTSNWWMYAVAGLVVMSAVIFSYTSSDEVIAPEISQVQQEETDIVTPPEEERVSDSELIEEVVDSGESNNPVVSNDTPTASTPSSEPSSDSKELAENTEVVSEEIRIEEPQTSGSKTSDSPVMVVEEPNQEFVPQIKASSVEICVGEAIDVEVVNAQYTDYSWSIGNGQTMSGISIYVEYDAPGIYSLRVNDLGQNTVSETIEITVNPKPKSDFQVTEMLKEGAVPVVQLDADQAGNSSYEWDLGDGYTGNGNEITHTYRNKGDYELSLKVSNKFGCKNVSHKRYYNPSAFNLLAPNSFSPNGDGINDEWFPAALSTGYYQFELSIYDRNNAIVYSTKDAQDSWNGITGGSKPNSGDFYIWKANVIDENGIHQQYGGTILIMY